MQCLFCGKELALLKRLRGGGEFCSEAHRKEYQDQYEQLALARLLQAKPPTESPSSARAPLSRPGGELPSAPDPSLESSYVVEEVPAPAAVATVEAPVLVKQKPAPPAGENTPAPLAGFLSEPVVPAVAPFEQAGLIELDNTWERVAALPSFSAQAN